MAAGEAPNCRRQAGGGLIAGSWRGLLNLSSLEKDAPCWSLHQRPVVVAGILRFALDDGSYRCDMTGY